MIEEIGYGAVSHLIAAKVGAVIAAVVSYMVAKYKLNDAEKRAATWREGHNKLLALDVKENAEIEELKSELEYVKRKSHLTQLERNKLRTELDQAKAKLKDANKELNDAKLDCATLRKQLSERADRMGRIRKERDNIKAKMAKLRAGREPTTHEFPETTTWQEIADRAQSLPLGDVVKRGDTSYTVVEGIKALRRMADAQ